MMCYNYPPVSSRPNKKTHLSCVGFIILFIDFTQQLQSLPLSRVLLLLLSRFSRVRLCATPRENTGVGCHFLLQYMKVKSESEVAQSCLTLSDPMDCSLPGSSIHGIFQARVLEWGAIAFSICQE